METIIKIKITFHDIFFNSSNCPPTDNPAKANKGTQQDKKETLPMESIKNSLTGVSGKQIRMPIIVA